MGWLWNIWNSITSDCNFPDADFVGMYGCQAMDPIFVTNRTGYVKIIFFKVSESGKEEPCTPWLLGSACNSAPAHDPLQTLLPSWCNQHGVAIK